jgi:hypothetical protein
MALAQKFTSIRAHLKKIILLAFSALVVFTLIVLITNSTFPVFFDPPKPDKDIPGWVFTSTIIDLGDQMFANWTPNDLFWPTVLLDNKPNFQIGELMALNYTVFRLKENLSRLRSSDTMDSDCSEAFTLLSNDPKKWIFPSAESRFKKAMEFLRTYRQKLESNQARFSPRADNLTELLAYYVSLLGTMNSELARAPGELRLKRPDAATRSTTPTVTTGSTGTTATPGTTTETTTATGAQPQPQPETKKPETEFNRVPYLQVDDNFYLAQGAAYVLREMMTAILVDFREILEVKKATELLEDIILTLDQSQFEPLIVLNGDIGSITANHSMELHSILENSRQKINNLIEMLSQ